MDVLIVAVVDGRKGDAEAVLFVAEADMGRFFHTLLDAFILARKHNLIMYLECFEKQTYLLVRVYVLWIEDGESLGTAEDESSI